MKIHLVFFFIALLSTGIMTGIFFTWTNAVTPGIGKLNDLSYLNALQSMNRVILNPLFYLAFFAPTLSLVFSAVFGYKAVSGYLFQLILAATIFYIAGVFLVTLFGNIPLNNLLENSDLSGFTPEDAKKLRDKIEIKWNNFNLVRTISSFSSFVLIIVVCLLYK